MSGGDMRMEGNRAAWAGQREMEVFIWILTWEVSEEESSMVQA